MSKSITVSNTDTICVAIRKAGVMRKEANRTKLYMEMLGFNERTALRLDWFVSKLSLSDVPLETEAIAAAWVANEEFYFNDGVNDWIWTGWDGTGGGDFTLVGNTLVPAVQQ
jgi:hypothetical protein